MRVSKLSFDMGLLYRSAWKMPRRFHARAPVVGGSVSWRVGEGEPGFKLSGAPTMRHLVTGRGPCPMAKQFGIPGGMNRGGLRARLFGAR